MASFPLIDLWKDRSLILHFSWINLKLRFTGSYLGLIWAALEPLLMFFVLYVVFTSIRKQGGAEFAIYLISGLILYQLFRNGTLGGLNSLRQNSGILNSLNINRKLFPTINAGTTFLILFANLVVLFALMPIVGFVPSWTLVFLPIILGLFLVLVLGVCYILSILYVYVRDIQPIWTVITYALLFASPIFWYVSEVDGILLSIQSINPVGQLIELTHKVVVFGTVPVIMDWVYTSAISFGIFFVGYAVFHKLEKNIVEII
jgi:ABC-type polysaccharide/polyol phosphate export permease